MLVCVPTHNASKNVTNSKETPSIRQLPFGQISHDSYNEILFIISITLQVYNPHHSLPPMPLCHIYSVTFANPPPPDTADRPLKQFSETLSTMAYLRPKNFVKHYKAEQWLVGRLRYRKSSANCSEQITQNPKENLENMDI